MDVSKSRRQTMTAKQIQTIIGSLAKSQGFYSRLYEQINSDNGWEKFAEEAVLSGITDIADLVNWIEE